LSRKKNQLNLKIIRGNLAEAIEVCGGAMPTHHSARVIGKGQGKRLVSSALDDKRCRIDRLAVGSGLLDAYGEGVGRVLPAQGKDGLAIWLPLNSCGILRREAVLQG